MSFGNSVGSRYCFPVLSKLWIILSNKLDVINLKYMLAHRCRYFRIPQTCENAMDIIKQTSGLLSSLKKMF